MVADVLAEHIDDETSARYLRWQRAQERELPLIVLIGGATGVGKSTVATQVANRLGITRIVSTDAVREVMRSTLSPELLPSLHVSSFEAREAVAEVHLVPGALDVPAPSESITVQIMLVIDDTDAHRSNLTGRSQDVASRPQQRYIEHFDEIRRIHDHLIRLAEDREVPTVRSYSLDSTVADVTARVVETVAASGERSRTGA